MKKSKLFICLFILPFVFVTSCQENKTNIPVEHRIENLKAFTKLYGYIRFFYPSEEAHLVNWDRLAIAGINKILNSHTNEQLIKSLDEVFKPLGSNIYIGEYQSKDYNSTFIRPEPGDSMITAWQHLGVGLSKNSNKYKSQRVYKNKFSWQIENKLFDDFPDTMKVYHSQLNKSLWCSFPLTLYIEKNSSKLHQKKQSFNDYVDELESIDINTLQVNDKSVQLAGVVIAWNIFQHFYPNFDITNVNWEQVLSETLRETLTCENTSQYYNILRKMIEKLNDGHGIIFLKHQEQFGGLPIRAEWIENNIVITASLDTIFKKGDMIKFIDGDSAINVLRKSELYISGSPQIKRFRALNQFGKGLPGSTAVIQLLRNGNLLKISYKRLPERRDFFFNYISEFNFPDIKELSDRVVYINLNTLTKDIFYKKINDLKNARGIIFDFRWGGEYTKAQPISYLDVIAHLVTDTIRSPRWNIPKIIYPDRNNIKYLEKTWSISPQYPSILTKVVFITDPGVISFGETIIDMVKYYKLGTIVGSSTGGTNGDANFIHLPGNYTIMWTGLKVIDNNGEQHPLHGITPDFPVKRTIESVKKGTDEYLQKAIEIINRDITES